MTGVLIKRGNLDTKTHIHRNRGRDWNGMYASQDTLKIASKPPEIRRDTWDRFFLTALKRNQC